MCSQDWDHVILVLPMQICEDKATQTENETIFTEKATQTKNGLEEEHEGDSLESANDDSGSETECEGDSPDPGSANESSEGEWYYEYESDPSYDGPPYHSLPMYSLRGTSYTPPGWMRVYKKRKFIKDQSASTQAAKKLKLE